MELRILVEISCISSLVQGRTTTISVSFEVSKRSVWSKVCRKRSIHNGHISWLQSLDLCPLVLHLAYLGPCHPCLTLILRFLVDVHVLLFSPLDVVCLGVLLRRMIINDCRSKSLPFFVSVWLFLPLSQHLG